ncbi:Pentatricopeptide repeat-containing -like protein [Gossypium arboreum]|uniref:Pentatricopeptide repeat-containing-like protein n=1 Tax=Gossypium arboreum TaxID=29729 RepID=A0A0B0P4X1_GOSAR|nr:Pentatricopeptide repeat-containing -like protein [Gossypium arboreum]
MPATLSRSIDRPWFKEQPRGNVFGQIQEQLLQQSQQVQADQDLTKHCKSQSLSTLWLGRQVHVKAFKSGLMSNLLVKTTLIHFYANNKDILLARSVFDEMTERSSATWNAMIKGYTSQRGRSKKCCREALVLFRDMLNDISGQIPTDTTMVCVLSACSQLGEFYSGACVHGFIEKTIWVPESDVFIGTGLVDMYAKCGYIDSALSIFRLMSVKNVLTWTAMGTGLAVHGRGKEALELLDAMEGSGIKPNPVTFTTLFSACCHTGLVEEGLHLFHNMRSRFGLEPQIQHYGCIVDLLGRAGYLNEAYDFIIEIPIKPDAVLWRSLLSACTIHGDLAMAEKVGKILLRLEPPKNSLHMPITSEDYIALSNVYASTGRWRQVEMVQFLEDFIDGAEVVSMLECIQLTAGPLLALAAAPWPARVCRAPVV